MSKEPRFDPGSRDELTRRRVQRRGAQADETKAGGDAEEHKFTWTDTFAMIIAAYQVLLPMLLAMVGALVLVYLAFIWFFG